MEAVKFHARVAAVRVARWLACRSPLAQPPKPAPIDPVDLPGRPDLVVEPSSIPGAGLGVFAGRAFAKGEVTCIYTGIRLTTLEALRTPDWRYLVVLGKNRRGERVWIDARPTLDVVARYINHHFEPGRRNIVPEPVPDEAKWLMRASRPIHKGEEFYYDYGAIHWHCFDRSLGPRSRQRSPASVAAGDAVVGLALARR